MTGRSLVPDWGGDRIADFAGGWEPNDGGDIRGSGTTGETELATVRQLRVWPAVMVMVSGGRRPGGCEGHVQGTEGGPQQ